MRPLPSKNWLAQALAELMANASRGPMRRGVLYISLNAQAANLSLNSGHAQTKLRTRAALLY